MRLLLASIFATCSIAAAHAQAFGITIGTKIGDLVVVDSKDAISHYYKVTPPEPNPSYDVYTVKATPLNGVCYVSASNSWWPEEREEVVWERILAALQSKYGEGEYSSEYQWIWRQPAKYVDYITMNQAGPTWPSIAYFFVNKDACDEEPDSIVDVTGF